MPHSETFCKKGNLSGRRTANGVLIVKKRSQKNGMPPELVLGKNETIIMNSWRVEKVSWALMLNAAGLGENPFSEDKHANVVAFVTERLRKKRGCDLLLCA